MTGDDALLRELLAAYEHERWELVNRSGAGTNNTTRFIRLDGQDYVVRRYETHRDAGKVRYEHAVLQALQTMQLSFHTPAPLLNKQGCSYTTLAASENKLAAIFTYAEGDNPSLERMDDIYAYGELTGALSAALSRIDVPLEPVYPPYYEIEASYPLCAGDALRQFCTKPGAPFAAQADKLSVIWTKFQAIRERLADLDSLPKQLVHGDLNRTNMLSGKDGRMKAVLDFEFTTLDVRAMELAVAIQDIYDPAVPGEQMLGRAEQFMRGYAVHGELSPEEARAIPLLMILRKFDVFLHFLSRYFDGVNDETLVMRFIGSLHEQLMSAEAGLLQLSGIIASFSE